MAESKGSDYKLSDELIECIGDLVKAFENEDRESRLDEIKRVQKARNFWQSRQYDWWDRQQGRYRAPHEAPNFKPELLPRFQYVLNIYKAYGNTIISVLGQHVPKTAWFPQNPNQERDVVAAKTAHTAAKFIQRNQKVKKLMSKIAYYFWTDGGCGAYSRYVADGDKYGYDEIPIMGEQLVQATPNMYVCPNCGNQQETSVTQAISCPICATPMDFVEGEKVPVPVQTGTERVPKGQEQISVIGKLELKTPMWTDDFYEFPYLIWTKEIHKARVRHLHKDNPRVKGIEGDGPADSLSKEERLARLETKSPTNPSSGVADKDRALVSYKLIWLRPWAFYALEDDKLRDQLLEKFPDGAHCVFADDTYLEARPEAMSDHWRVAHAEEGDGQSRAGLGDPLIPAQECFNDLFNIHTETYERGIPAKWVSTKVVNQETINNQLSIPGAIYGVDKAPTGRPLSDAFFEEAVAHVSPDMMKFMNDLFGPIAQFLVGAFPALFGGDMESQETASGYSMARDQSLGRVSSPYSRMTEMFTDMMVLSVLEFGRNRRVDEVMVELGDGGAYDQEAIKLEDLQGKFFAYPETDDQIPLMWSQIRSQINALMQQNNPIIQRILAHPANQALLKKTMGSDDMTVPDEDIRAKQLKEIEQLLVEAPVAGPVDPMNPQPVLAPSVPIGLLDYHEVELETVRLWMVSPKGIDAKVNNTMGFANVEAHGMAHYQQIQMLQMQQAQAQAQAEGGAEGGEPQ